MKIKKAFLRILALSVATVLFLVLAGCTGAAKMEDYYGKLQAVDGEVLVLTLNDGTTARIKVEDAKTISKAQGLVGAQVWAKVRNLALSEIQPLGENGHISGVIESITNYSVVISGRTLKITPDTMLDGGLAPGIMARSEFIKASDGSLRAIEIETVRESMKLTGVIASMNANTIVIKDKTCKVDSAARLEDGLAPGFQARVRLITTSDGSMVAVAVEREQGDDRFTGKVEAIRPDALVIGGKIVRINSATSFEQGLSEGALVRVRFIVMNDGSLLATRVEVEKRRIELEREQESQSLEEQVRVQERQLQSRMERVMARDLELRRRQKELEQFEQEFSGRVDEAKQRADDQQLRRRVVEGEGSQESESGGSSTGDAVGTGGTAVGSGTTAGGGTATGGTTVGGGTATGGSTVGVGADTGGTTVGAGADAGGATGGTDTGGSGGSSGGGSDDSSGGSGGSGGGGSDDSSGGGSGGGGGSDDSGGGGGGGGGNS